MLIATRSRRRGSAPRAVLAACLTAQQGLAAEGSSLHPRFRGTVATPKMAPQARTSLLLVAPCSLSLSLPSLFVVFLLGAEPHLRHGAALPLPIRHDHVFAQGPACARAFPTPAAAAA